MRVHAAKFYHQSDQDLNNILIKGDYLKFGQIVTHSNRYHWKIIKRYIKKIPKLTKNFFFPK